MSAVAQDLEELFALLSAEEDHRRYNKIDTMYPASGKFSIDKYPKHMEAFAAGALYNSRMVCGGNGVGKTEGLGGYELALHLTGLYPSWWCGLRFDKPIDAWAFGDTMHTVRNIIQAKIFGEVATKGDEFLGTGLIPRHLIGKPRFIPNTNYTIDYCTVKHVSGGWSVVQFKSYDQGRRTAQGTEKDFILLDEEPPPDIYEECIHRFRGRDKYGLLLTFTPLQGYTEVVEGFEDYEKQNKAGASKYRIRIGWADVPHLTEEYKRTTLADTRPHMRDARRLGLPTSGVGRVYPVEDESFIINPIAIPDHWRRAFALDHGWHATAAVHGAWDKDNDTWYIYADYQRGEQPISVHAAVLRARGDWIPGFGDCSARDSDGKQIVTLYRNEKIKMRLPDKAVDAGIQEVLNRLGSGRLKIFTTCQKLIECIRRYRYDEKLQIVKKDDHLADALRYLIFKGHTIATTRQAETNFTNSEVSFG